MKRRTPAELNGGAWLGGLILLWLWVWKHLSLEWRLNEDYSYGFAVPFLAVFLGWNRFREWQSHQLSHVPPVPAHWPWLIPLAAIVFVPAELLRLQDPMWRFSGWLLMFSATAMLVTWLGQIGGRTLVRSLALPIGFSWLAAPWPSAIETPVVLALLELATTVSVDLLNWLGIPALQHGNLIQLKRGMVGVERACSGIQSLQASLMITLFAGEWFRLTTLRRCVLLATGLVLALLMNMARVFALAHAVHLEGDGAIDTYHNQIGGTATTILAATILLLAWLLKSNQTKSKLRSLGETSTAELASKQDQRLPLPAGAPSIARHDESDASPSRAMLGAPVHGEGERNVSTQSGQITKITLPEWRLAGKSGFAVLALAVFIPLGAQLWMQRGTTDTATQNNPLWQVLTNGLKPGWQGKMDGFTPEELKLLRFSEGHALNVASPDRQRFHVMHLFWKPEATVPSLAYSHRPDICLPSAGWKQTGTPEPLTLQVAGREITGLVFKFNNELSAQTVFHAVWYGGEPHQPSAQPDGVGNRFERLALLWKEPGRRNHEILSAFAAADISPSTHKEVFQGLLEQVLYPADVPAGR